MLILTNTGYKFTPPDTVFENITEPFTAASDGLGAISGFFDTMEKEGIWNAITGKDFGVWLGDVFQATIDFIASGADILIIVGMIEMLLIMFGSTRARKWLYWTIALYLILKIVGVML